MILNHLFSFLHPGLAKRLDLILFNQGLIMSTQAQLAQALETLKTQNDAARAEVVALIASLRDAIVNNPVAPEVQTAFDALRASVQMDDDIVP